MSDTIITTRYDDATALGAGVADALVEAVAGARARRRPALVGWPVGRTTEPVARALAGADLKGVIFVLMDDYVEESSGHPRRVPLTHPCSCRGAALSSLPVPPESVWSPDPSRPAAYDERIAAAGGIDVFVVALGASDGHVGLNPPGSEPDARTRIVDVAESTRRDNLATFGRSDLADVPARGVTVGLGTITAARRLFVVARGEAKRDVVRRLRAARTVDPAWPMTAVRTHADVRYFLDRAAAGDS